jgi:hypothetical protein
MGARKEPDPQPLAAPFRSKNQFISAENTTLRFRFGDHNWMSASSRLLVEERVTDLAKSRDT